MKEETSIKEKKYNPKKKILREFQSKEVNDKQNDEDYKENEKTKKRKKTGKLVEGVDFVWKVSKSGTRYKYSYKKKPENEKLKTG